MPPKTTIPVTPALPASTGVTYMPYELKMNIPSSTGRNASAAGSVYLRVPQAHFPWLPNHPLKLLLFSPAKWRCCRQWGRKRERNSPSNRFCDIPCSVLAAKYACWFWRSPCSDKADLYLMAAATGFEPVTKGLTIPYTNKAIPFPSFLFRFF